MDSKAWSVFWVKVPLQGSNKPLPLTKAGFNHAPPLCQQATSGSSLCWGGMYQRKLQVPEKAAEKCLTSQLRYGMWGQSQAPWNPSKTQEGPTPSGQEGAPTIGQQHLAYKMTPSTLKCNSAHLQAQASSHRNQGVFPKGKSTKYGQFFSFSKSR